MSKIDVINIPYAFSNTYISKTNRIQQAPSCINHNHNNSAFCH